jgi:hypothetical protein
MIRVVQGWIWSKYIICLHGNITMKPLCRIKISNKKEKKILKRPQSTKQTNKNSPNLITKVLMSHVYLTFSWGGREEVLWTCTARTHTSLFDNLLFSVYLSEQVSVPHVWIVFFPPDAFLKSCSCFLVSPNRIPIFISCSAPKGPHWSPSHRWHWVL